MSCHNFRTISIYCNQVAEDLPAENKNWRCRNMARGVRKSPKEKLEEKLISVEEAITQYSECLDKLKNEKDELERELEQLEIAELSAILKEKHLSVSELRDMVNQAG